MSSHQVTVGAGTIYGYASLAPIILWIAFKWLEIPVTLLQNVCIYGYSLFVFLPVAVCKDLHSFLRLQFNPTRLCWGPSLIRDSAFFLSNGYGGS